MGSDKRLTDDARNLWTEFAHGVIAPMRGQEGKYYDLLGRIDLTMKKLALLFALDKRESMISEDSIAKAILLWDYLADTYKVVSGEVGSGAYEDATRDILKAINAFEATMPRPPSARDIIRSVGTDHSHDIIRKALENMVRLGLLEEKAFKPATGGHATTVYHYVE